MSTKARLSYLVGLILLTILLNGCSTPNLQVEPIALSENPSEQIESLETELTTARVNELHILAPESMAAAREALDAALEGLREDKGVETILQKVALGRAHLEEAREQAVLARTVLARPLEARRIALEAGAVQIGSDYLTVENRLVELARALENERLDWAARHAPEVAQQFSDLELRAIKNTALGEARRILAQAEKQGAENMVPASFARAREILQETDDYITNNRYQTDIIEDKARNTLFEARRTAILLDYSRQFKEMTPEQIALFVEELLRTPTLRLAGQPELRDRPFEAQAETLARTITELQAGQQAQKSQIEAARQQIASLEGITEQEKAAKELYIWEQKATKEKLERERRFQQIFDEIQEMFAPEEAEVYKQGNHLVIRLRGIRFPVGKAIIAPNNYPLLGKVRRAIRTFNEPAVTIEGHTDSTGSDAANASLSQARADAVRQYFVANEILPPDRIIAVGYGSRRPLAPNTTAEGRAINRRIDVIITPQSQSSL
jgi:outer membrane protein OmpA-like peptidoglycan-associated protein